MGRIGRAARAVRSAGEKAARAARRRRNPAGIPTTATPLAPNRPTSAPPRAPQQAELNANRRYRATTAGRPHVRRMPERTLHTSQSSPVPRWLSKYGLGAWYLIGICIIIAALVYFTSKIELVFIAVFLALVFTSVLWPIVSWLARWMPRALAVLLSLLGTFGIFGGMIFYVAYSVSGEWNDLADQFSNGIDQIVDFMEHGPLPWHLTRQEISDGVKDLVDQGTAYVQDNAGDLASQVLSNAGVVAIIFTILALSLFVTIFFLYKGDKMWLWFLNELPARNRENTHRAAAAGWLTFSGYARGTMIVAVSDALFAFILLWLLGIPLAAPLAVLVLIGAFIPLVGAPTAMVIAMIVALAADGIGKAIMVGLGIALIGQFEGHVLQPLVMGKQVALHPVVVALGVTAGTFLAGLLGAVIAIPIIAVIWAVYSTLHDKDPRLEELPEVDEEELLNA
ncbi:MAG: AI-2E family transporter [Bowdeniella nasicola]|nr:AI-2E family transporter [Bowdeniella nasicola]